MLSTLRWSAGIAVHTCAAMRLLNKFVVLAAALAGCTSGPDFVRPDKPKEQGYTPENLAPQTAASAVADGGAAQTFVPAKDIPGQWWTLFRSAELNALIDEALKANPDLDAAQASLRQANEALYAQQGALFPAFNANASGQNALANGVQFGQPGTSFYYGVTTASLNISYAPHDAGQGLLLASLKLPEELPLSLPSQLVEQRPDVRSAEAQLHTASANIGVAVANQLPQLTLTGMLGMASAGISTAFIPGTGIWSLGASIAQILFDGGKLEHTKLAAVAAYDKAAAQYRSTVLLAFQDVANALRALEADAETLKATVAAEQVAAASLTLVQQQYQAGSINYLTLFNAQQTYQNPLINRVKAQAQRYRDTAALFQAVGGGWWNRTDVDPASKGAPGVFNLPPVQDIKLPRGGQQGI